MQLLSLIRYVVLSSALFTGLLSIAQAEELALPETVRYSSADWPAALGADIYHPNTSGLAPTVLVIHGGGWNAGTRDAGYVKSICGHLQRNGYAAVAVSYRLAPEARFPAQLNDMSEAVRWLAAHGAEHGLDTNTIAVWGYSAGAHLASLMSTQPQALPIVAVIAGGTPADLRDWPKSAMVLDLLGKSRDDAPELWTEASPIAQVNGHTPPHFLYHGRLDTLVEYSQAERLKAALEAVNVPVELYTRWLYGHFSTALFPGSSFTAATHFLAPYLASKAAASTIAAAELPHAK
ncbi:MAG: alpha/beta hydrolase [Paraperlucidibaca sp.]